MPESAVDVVVPLPAEVEALGTPLRVFAPGKRDQPPLLNLLVAAALGCIALFCWGLAAVVAGLVEFPDQPPPPEDAALFIGVPCMVLGTVFLLVAAWYGTGGGVCTQTYLLYDDCLVELFPDRHRVIPWEKVGTPTEAASFVKYYKFPVRAGKPIRFDYSMAKHERLYRAITRQKMLHLLGGEEALDALPTDTAAPHFVATLSPWFAPAASYRVSVVGKNLLFLWVGKGETRAPRFGAAHMGGAGAVGFLVRHMKHQEFRRRMEAAEDAHERELFDLAAEQGGSFLLPFDEVREWHIDTADFWQQFTQNGAGYLKLVQKDGTAQTLYLSELEDVSTARGKLMRLREQKRSRVLHESR